MEIEVDTEDIVGDTCYYDILQLYHAQCTDWDCAPDKMTLLYTLCGEHNATELVSLIINTHIGYLCTVVVSG